MYPSIALLLCPPPSLVGRSAPSGFAIRAQSGALRRLRWIASFVATATWPTSIATPWPNGFYSTQRPFTSSASFVELTPMKTKVLGYITVLVPVSPTPHISSPGRSASSRISSNGRRPCKSLDDAHSCISMFAAHAHSPFAHSRGGSPPEDSRRRWTGAPRE